MSFANKKIKTGIILFFIIVIVAGFFFRTPHSKKIIIDKNINFTYKNQGTLKGKFIFSLRNYQPIEEYDPKLKSYLIALSDTGEILFDTTAVSGWKEKFFKYNFTPLGNDSYAYFAGTFDDAISNRASVYFMNKKYEQMMTIVAPEKEPDLDGQDIYKSADGHIFYLFERRNVSGTIIDNEIQERDTNGNVVFFWSARIAYNKEYKVQVLEDSEPFQLNSISLDNDKNIIVSLSRLNQIIKVEYPSGKILWRINQEDWTIKNDNFKGFKKQHHVQLLPNGNLLLLDIGDKSTRPSRAVEYKIDVEHKILELVWEYRLTGPYAIRESEGSVQRLSNGHTLIGWGRPNTSKANIGDTLFTEVTPDGKVIREMKTDSAVVAYRVYFEEEK